MLFTSTLARNMSEPLTLLSLPLFPLGTVLFPGGSLPLQIFEVRYLDMIGKCHRSGSPFGVVTLTKGSEVRRPDAGQPGGDGFAEETFHPVGTLATITDFSSPQPWPVCPHAERVPWLGALCIGHRSRHLEP